MARSCLSLALFNLLLCTSVTSLDGLRISSSVHGVAKSNAELFKKGAKVPGVPKVTFVKELWAPTAAAFTSCHDSINTISDHFVCYHRHVTEIGEMSSRIDKVSYTKEFEYVDEHENIVDESSEDPRVLNSTHVLLNHYCANCDGGSFKHMSLVNMQSNKTHRIMRVEANGEKTLQKEKNHVFFSYKNELYAIGWFSPLELYKCHLDNDGEDIDCMLYVNEEGDHTRDRSKEWNHANFTYHGGTMGYADGHGGVWGFGHTKRQSVHTRYDGNGKEHVGFAVIHKPFFWYMDMENGPKFLTDLAESEMVLPGSHNLTDPTSVAISDDGFYLLTVESDHLWRLKYGKQEYHNKVYKLHWDSP